MPQTIQTFVESILREIPCGPLEDTVDTFKCGDPSQPVSGVVTTFIASYEVIQRAAALGANLIIAHEPTFYNHRDEIGWLAGNPTYQVKRRLLDDTGIVVWRFHDYWHSYEPDGITTGVVRQLGWENYLLDGSHLPLFDLPPTTVGDLAQELKEKLGISTVRLIGDVTMPCRRVGLLVGAPGGEQQIGFLDQATMDVLLTGEIHEWETSEYVRDAIATGRKLALLVLGHVNSEEAGMAYLADWLRVRFPDLPVTYVQAGNPFTYV